MDHRWDKRNEEAILLFVVCFLGLSQYLHCSIMFLHIIFYLCFRKVFLTNQCISCIGVQWLCHYKHDNDDWWKIIGLLWEEDISTNECINLLVTFIVAWHIHKQNDTNGIIYDRDVCKRSADTRTVEGANVVSYHGLSTAKWIM